METPNLACQSIAIGLWIAASSLESCSNVSLLISLARPNGLLSASID